MKFKGQDFANQLLLIDSLVWQCKRHLVSDVPRAQSEQIAACKAFCTLRQMAAYDGAPARAAEAVKTYGDVCLKLCEELKKKSLISWDFSLETQLTVAVGKT